MIITRPKRRLFVLARAYGIALALFLSLIGSRAANKHINIDPEYPESFRYTNSERFFPMGDTAYFLIAQPTNVIARYIDSRRAYHFNFVRVMAMADGFWPFGGTPREPTYTTVEEAAMKKWDWVFDYAEGRGMNIELILWGYGLGGGEGLWARSSDQIHWVNTLVNRFKTRENLFMFTIANEFERYPDGQYRYEPSDVDWARGIAARIREIDQAHPIGCHPSVWITDQDELGKGDRPFCRYNGFLQRLPQVVWPLWHESAVNLNVTQNNEGVQPRIWGGLGRSRSGLTYYSTNWQGAEYPVKWTATGWDFEAPGLQHSLGEDRSHGKPVINSEFGYQYEPGYEHERSYTTRQCHDPATVRKKAWKIAVSGCYFAVGFESTAVRNFTVKDVTNFRPRQFETLYRFFTERIEYWKMAPRVDLIASQNVLLALPGKEYVAYFPRGGTNYISLVGGSYAVEWLHPESGTYHHLKTITVPDGRGDFVPPERLAEDWLLHLRVNSDAAARK
jgi:hypothetical protein